MSKQLSPLSVGLVLTPTVVLLTLCIWAFNSQTSFGATNLEEPREPSSSIEPFMTEGVCGNGLQESGEQCDAGVDNGNGSMCRANCTTVRCGDSILDEGSGEQCDTGASNGQFDNQCSSTCQLRYCGDGFVGSNEQCDDNNQIGGDGCDETCRTESGFICSNSAAMPSVCVAFSSSSSSSFSSSSLSSSVRSSRSAVQSSVAQSSVFSSSISAPVSSTNASAMAAVAALMKTANELKTEASFDQSFMLTLNRVVQGSKLTSSQAAQLTALSEALETVIATRDTNDAYFQAMTALVTPFTEDIVIKQGMKPEELVTSVSAAVVQLANLSLTGNPGINTLFARVSSDTLSPLFSEQRSAIASVQKDLAKNDVQTIKKIATLAQAISEKAVAPADVEPTLKAVYEKTQQLQASDITAFYPQVSQPDLQLALQQISDATAATDASPESIQAILKAVDRLAEVMRKGGVDIATLDAVPPDTDQFLQMAKESDKKAAAGEKAIDTFADRAVSNEARILRTGTPPQQMEALSAWVASRTTHIDNLIQRLPQADQIAARTQWKNLEMKLQELSASKTLSDTAVRSAIQEIYAYTDRLEKDVQQNFNAFDRFVDFFQRNLFRISA
ncbi:MAG: DUF4215 domain-containing protein [Candidatus Peribacteraceae bacterium]|nr:DUF4215 domain-containing protein [Candidatus Peribacteraceae bacterium]